MAISYVGASTIKYGTTFAAHVPALPAGIQAGDLMVIAVGLKGTWSDVAAAISNGWKYAIREALDGTAPGNDVGRTWSFTFWKEAVGGEGGTTPPQLIAGTPSVEWTQCVVFRKGAGTSWDTRVVSSMGSVGGGLASYSAVMDAYGTGGALTNGVPTGSVVNGDWLFAHHSSPTDIGAGAAFSGYAMTATGLTTTGWTEISEPFSASGQDIGGFLAYGRSDSGSNTAAISLSYNIGGTNTNQYGPVNVLRMRELIPPPVPTGVSASTNAVETVLVNWNSEPEAATYDVYRDGGLIGSTAGVSFTDNEALGLDPATNYSYQVRAVKADGAASALTTGVVGRALVGPPPATATPSGSGQITIGWTNRPNYGQVVKIRRDGVLIHTSATQPTTGTGSYDDTGLTIGVEYEYEVTATYGGEESAPRVLTASALVIRYVLPTDSGESEGLTGTGVTWTNSGTEPFQKQMAQLPTAAIDLNRYVQLQNSAGVYGDYQCYFAMPSPFWDIANDYFDIYANPTTSPVLWSGYELNQIFKMPVSLHFYVTGYSFAADATDCYFQIFGGGSAFFDAGFGGNTIIATIKNHASGGESHPEWVGQWVTIQATLAQLADWQRPSQPPNPATSSNGTGKWGEPVRAGFRLVTRIAQTVRIHGIAMSFALASGPKMIGADIQAEGGVDPDVGLYGWSFLPTHPIGDYTEIDRYEFGYMRQGMVGPTYLNSTDPMRYQDASYPGGEPDKDENGRVHMRSSNLNGGDSGDLRPPTIYGRAISRISSQKGPWMTAEEAGAPMIIPGKMVVPDDTVAWPLAGTDQKIRLWVQGGEAQTPMDVRRSDLDTSVLVAQGNGGSSMSPVASAANGNAVDDVTAPLGVDVKYKLRPDTRLWPDTAVFPTVATKPWLPVDQRGSYVHESWYWANSKGVLESTALAVANWHTVTRLAPNVDITATGRIQTNGITDPGVGLRHTVINTNPDTTWEFTQVQAVVNNTYTAAAVYEVGFEDYVLPAGHTVRDVYVLWSGSAAFDLATGGIELRLLQGGTTIKTWTKQEVAERSVRWSSAFLGQRAYMLFRLTPAERALITDYNALQLRFTASRLQTNVGVTASISAVDIRVCSAPAAFVAPTKTLVSSSDSGGGVDTDKLQESKVAVLPPDAIVATTGVVGSVAVVQDDPATPDASYLDGSGADQDLRVSFPTPAKPLHTGLPHTFRLRVRED